MSYYHYHKTRLYQSRTYFLDLGNRTCWCIIMFHMIQDNCKEKLDNYNIIWKKLYDFCRKEEAPVNGCS